MTERLLGFMKLTVNIADNIYALCACLHGIHAQDEWYKMRGVNGPHRMTNKIAGNKWMGSKEEEK